MAEPGSVQVQLITKEKKYAIPNHAFSLPVSATEVHLNSMIKSLLKDNEVEAANVVFDFLLLGELLRSSLQEQLETKEIPIESKLEIEYFVKYPAPFAENSLYHDDWVSAVRATEDWILSGCYDNTLHLWNKKNGVHKLTIPGHVAPVKSVSWIESGDPISTFVSTAHDETAMLWQWNQNTNSVDCINICKGHVRSVDCVDVCQAQQMFVTGSYDQTLKLWSADMQGDGTEECGDDSDGNRKRQKIDSGKSKIKTPLRTLSGHNDGISGVQWTIGSEVLTCSMDHTLRMWDVELGVQKRQINGSKAFFDISYSPHSRTIVAGSADNHIRLYDPRSQEGSVVKSAFTSHCLWVTAIKWSQENEFQFISGSHDMLVKLWDTRSTKSCLYDMLGHEDKVLSVDWSSRNHIISGGADNNVKIFKVVPGHPETSEVE